ncbi:MAG: sulfite exporter TauE/SafE family protein [SAR324 cluster bacterium]|nr:sulfite exporter TauE/SafE family protein [SAR324 cluster bacterium]MCZ6728163.1 sulfite exporter TauE/SafE family protein [SAR324 cluster bacterium]
MNEFVLLPIVGFIQAAFTAVVGLGGGPVLLAALLIFMRPADAIPFHGMVQICATLTRVVLLWRHISWPLVWRFSLLLAPGGAVGMWVLQGLSERMILILIGSFILFMLVVREFRFLRELRLPYWGFIPLGFMVGIMVVTVGVAAIFTGAFMMRKELSKESINATLGCCGTLGHVVKITAFGLVGFDFIKAFPAFLAMLPAVVLGSLLGRVLLRYISERFFLLMFKLTMVALCLKLVLWDGVIVYLL